MCKRYATTIQLHHVVCTGTSFCRNTRRDRKCMSDIGYAFIHKIDIVNLPLERRFVLRMETTFESQ